MSESWKIDPAKGDYIIDASGNPVIDLGLHTPAYFRIRTPRQDWMYAPNTNYGSEFARNKLKQPGLNRNIAIAFVRQALQPMIDDGRAASIDVSIESQARGSVQFKVKILDAEGNPQQILLLPIG